MRLAVACDWSDELRCFDTFLHELGFFYMPSLLPDQRHPDSPSAASDSAYETDVKAQLKNVVSPAMKAYLEPSKALVAKATLVTSLQELYRVFERSALLLLASQARHADLLQLSQVLNRFAKSCS